jgi:hypothetical protein
MEGDAQLLLTAQSDSLSQGMLKSPQSMVRLWGERVRWRSDLPLIIACI